VIDAATLEIEKRVPLAGVPIRVALTSDGDTALVSCAGSGEVVAIDTQSLSIVARRRLDVPIAEAAKSRAATALARGSVVPVGLLVAADDRSAYVAATAADAIVRLELPGLDVAQTIAVPGEPDGLGRTGLLPKYKCHACEPGAE
jgi:DNA-binding beta-propeller fold protein YncE